MLKMEFIGHIGQDAVVNMIDGGKSVINFSVAITEKWLNKQNVQVENTIWVACSKFGDGVKIAEYLKKGTMVYVTGKPITECYQRRSGEWTAQQKCVVDRIDLLTSTKRADEIAQTAGAGNTSQPQDNLQQPVDDDLPF